MPYQYQYMPNPNEYAYLDDVISVSSVCTGKESNVQNLKTNFAPVPPPPPPPHQTI